MVYVLVFYERSKMSHLEAASIGYKQFLKNEPDSAELWLKEASDNFTPNVLNDILLHPNKKSIDTIYVESLLQQSILNWIKMAAILPWLY